MVQEALGHPLCFYIISCSHSTFAPLAASEPLWLRAAKCYLYLIMNNHEMNFLYSRLHLHCSL